MGQTTWAGYHWVTSRAAAVANAECRLVVPAAAPRIARIIHALTSRANEYTLLREWSLHATLNESCRSPICLPPMYIIRVPSSGITRSQQCRVTMNHPDKGSDTRTTGTVLVKKFTCAVQTNK